MANGGPSTESECVVWCCAVQRLCSVQTAVSSSETDKKNRAKHTLIYSTSFTSHESYVVHKLLCLVACRLETGHTIR